MRSQAFSAACEPEEYVHFVNVTRVGSNWMACFCVHILSTEL